MRGETLRPCRAVDGGFSRRASCGGGRIPEACAQRKRSSRVRCTVRGSMSAEIAPDTIIGGRYRIRRLLGRGGMGMVYEAEHTSLRRIVALKMLVPEAATDGPAVMRFLQEARAA